MQCDTRTKKRRDFSLRFALLNAMLQAHYSDEKKEAISSARKGDTVSLLLARFFVDLIV
jgi:hypothetical protein